ncbi:hypothetical protein T12_8375 [Trichinella patagoniensis]|uniref:Uncharacterized protein n=1 Tax=Trichinella patagoniensis TaxID=990121 RepID=A0A0V0Z855_9BILA|nr:hypothetical protein T12_8375 [Trichinella patagoniensis]
MNHMKLPRYTRKRDVINNKRRFRKRSNATFFDVNSLLSMESVRKRLSSTPEMYVLFMYAVNDYIAKQSTTCSFVCRVVGLTNGCPYVTNEIKSLIKDGSKFYLHGMVIHFYCPIDRQWRIIKEDEIKNELDWMEILMENAKNITLTDHTYITNLYRHCMLSQMSRIKEKRHHYIYYTPELFLYFRIATRYFTIFIPFLQMPLTVIHFAALCACWNYIRTMIMKAWKKTFRKYFAKALHYIENKLNIPQYTLMNITLPRYTRKRDVINNKRRFRKRSNATFFDVNSLLSMESVRKRLSSTPEMYVLFMYAVNDYIAKQSTTCSFVCRVVGLTNGCPYVTNEIKSLIKDGSKFYLHGMVIHFYCPIDRQWRIIKEDEIKNELDWMEILMENAKLQRTDDVDKIKFYRDGHGIKISIDFFQKVKEHYADRPHIYHKFIQALHAFTNEPYKGKTTPLYLLYTRVVPLFSDCNTLLHHFHSFFANATDSHPFRCLMCLLELHKDDDYESMEEDFSNILCQGLALY